MGVTTYVPPSDRIIHNAAVDFGERWSLGTAVNLMQYDKTLPIIAVSLYSGGQPYTIPSSADLNVRVGKSDGTKVYNPVLGCNSTRNAAYIEVTRQISAVYGPALATLELIIEGNVAYSSYILLDVAKNPAQDDAIESTNEYKSLLEPINDAKDAIGKMPIIQNETWWLWDSEKKVYVNTDFPARGETGLQGNQGETGATGNGIASTILNNDYTLTIQFTDGTSYTTPSIRGKIGPTGSRGPQGLTGETGATGNGIASTILNNDYTLTIQFTDGTSYTTPSIRGLTGAQGKQGEKGETGNGIASTVLNENYTLTITFTDGTSYTTPTPIRGEIGLTGPEGPRGLTGATGAQGQKGEKGDTGNGIANTVLNDDYTLTITFTDGTEYKTPSIRGATGAQGQKGEKGDTGSGFKVLGYYATESALSAAVTNPAAGDAYGIGTVEPYDIYIWDGVNRKWVNNGALQGAKGDPGIQGEQGIQGIQGPAGKDGKTPVVGVDYFTASDKEEMVNSVYALITNGDTASYGS